MPRRKATAGPLDPGGDYDPGDDDLPDDLMPSIDPPWYGESTNAELDHRKESRDGDKGKEKPAAKRGKPHKESRIRGDNKGH